MNREQAIAHIAARLRQTNESKIFNAVMDLSGIAKVQAIEIDYCREAERLLDDVIYKEAVQQAVKRITKP
jgi:hypothetical protein